MVADWISRRAGRRTGRGASAFVLVGVAIVMVGCSLGTTDESMTGPDTTVTTTVEIVPDVVTTAPQTDSVEGLFLEFDEVGQIDDPVAIASRSGSESMYVVDRDGRIRRVAARTTYDRDGSVRSVSYALERGTVLDIRSELRGNRSEQRADGEAPVDPRVLDIAFSTDGRRLYVHFIDGTGANVVHEYRVEGDRAVTDSRRELLRVPPPNNGEATDHTNAGGGLLIGPDGFLYVGIGDRTTDLADETADAPRSTAQDPATLSGSLLRIDPDGAGDGQAYAVPSSNPFTDNGGAPEVWMIGAHDPWRFSFDRATGDLWIGDRRGMEDTVSWLPSLQGAAGKGANLGWRLAGDREADEGAVPSSLVVLDRTAEACGVVGGLVYRGEMLPDLEGAYLFGDGCAPTVQAMLATTGVVLQQHQVAAVPGGLVDIAEDLQRELWVLSGEGAILRIVGTDGVPVGD
ncbi:MAG: PQQ-dependent sugar dehydrogenase [Acidimicrobiia bacterium]|nr:PQQ-dependent sugar dehydrogenase [Acidimicrobiia bacterium]